MVISANLGGHFSQPILVNLDMVISANNINRGNLIKYYPVLLNTGGRDETEVGPHLITV